MRQQSTRILAFYVQNVPFTSGKSFPNQTAELWPSDPRLPPEMGRRYIGQPAGDAGAIAWNSAHGSAVWRRPIEVLFVVIAQEGNQIDSGPRRQAANQVATV